MKNINNYSIQARNLANYLDELDGKDGTIKRDTWQKYAVKNWGAKDNVKKFISLFNATQSIEQYLNREINKSRESKTTIGTNWFNELISLKTKMPDFEPSKTDNKPVDPVEIADKSKPIEALLVDNSNNMQKDKIITKMHRKWSAKFKNSNLDKNFYNKLYDVIKILNCEIDDKDYDQSKYSSKEEQTMEEVIAVLAGESKLNSKASYHIYRGLFQLDAASLQTVKTIGEKYNISGIKQNITLNQFANLSGAEQLNYLVGHITYARIRSGLTQDEKITPSQLWAMIQLPNKGQKDNNVVQRKNKAINKIFNVNQIERGIA